MEKTKSKMGLYFLTIVLILIIGILLGYIIYSNNNSKLEDNKTQETEKPIEKQETERREKFYKELSKNIDKELQRSRNYMVWYGKANQQMLYKKCKNNV